MGAPREYYVYVHLRPDLTPFYVGKGSGARAYDMVRRNRYHKNVTNKYGVDSVIVELQPCATEGEAFLRERIVISALRSNGVVLCNMTDGGEGASGYRYSDEQRKALSERMRTTHRWVADAMISANRNQSAETRAKLAEAARGRKHTPETKAKISKARLNMSDETRRKMSNVQKGRVVDSETRRKLSEAARNASPETRRKLSEAAKNRGAEANSRMVESLRVTIIKKRELGLMPLGRRYLKKLRDECQQANIEAQ